MKRLLVLALLATACTVPAANAAAAKGPTLAQFNALKTQLKKDENKITTLEGAINFTIAFALCQNAATADAFQGTWGVIDQMAQATQAGKSYFGPQTPITDLQACAQFKKPVVRSQAVPPTTSVFSALATLLS